jgi:hypothetical protein
MKKFNYVLGMACALLAALAFASCKGPYSESTDYGGSGSGTGINGGGGSGGGGSGGGGDSSFTASDIDSFDGDAVTSESDATTLAEGAQNEITTAVTEALESGTEEMLNRTAYGGTWSWTNGNGGKISVVYSEEDNNDGSIASYEETITIHGNWGGYYIIGEGLRVKATYTWHGSSSFEVHSV